MTLIASLRSNHGAMILADSQETCDSFRRAVLKLETKTVRHYRYLIAGSGEDAGDIDTTIERFQRSLEKSRCKSISGFRRLFEKELDRLSTRAQKEMELLVAVVAKGKIEIWRSEKDTLIPTKANQPTLVGFERNFYEGFADRWMKHSSSTAQILLVGLRVLELARGHSIYVDRPYSAAVVTTDGIFPLPKALLEQLAESLRLFGEHLDRMLLSCSDTTTKASDFQAKLQEFCETAPPLRREFLESVAEIEIRLQTSMFDEMRAHGGQAEIGYPFVPIPMVPPGSITSGSYDHKTGKLTVSVGTYEEHLLEHGLTLPFALDVPVEKLWRCDGGVFFGRSIPNAKCLGPLPFGLK